MNADEKCRLINEHEQTCNERPCQKNLVGTESGYEMKIFIFSYKSA